jgi:hypothetical protein
MNFLPWGQSVNNDSVVVVGVKLGVLILGLHHIGINGEMCQAPNGIALMHCKLSSIVEPKVNGIPNIRGLGRGNSQI